MPTWLAVLLAVVSALAAISTVAMVIFSASRAGTNARLRVELSDVRVERDDAYRARDRERSERSHAEKQLDWANGRIKTLTEAVTQAAAVKQLAEALSDHSKAVGRRHDHHDETEEKILKLAGDILRRIEGK